MSSSSLPPVGLSDFQTLVISRYFGPAIATLAVYECSLTVAEEVEYLSEQVHPHVYVHRGGRQAGTAQRVSRAVNHLVLLRCARGSRIGFVVILLPYPVSAGFSVMRTFALTGENWTLTSVALVLSVVPVSINLVSSLMLVFTLENIDIMYGMNSSDVVVFTQSMSAILLHRFLLHLRSTNRRTLAVSSERSEGEQGVAYASMEFGRAEVSRGSMLALKERHGNTKAI
ncbi:hypothetical protein V8D89_004954 [Ganoderma adspersum]